MSRGARGSQQNRRNHPQGRIARLREFVRGVRSELRKVSWPNRDQLRQSTAVVIIIVLTLGAYVAAWDFVFGAVAGFIFG